jgi:hypothetical protein
MSLQWSHISGAIAAAPLSRTMLAVLVDHCRGPHLVRVQERATIQALRARRLVYFNRNVRPTHSLLTKRGREVIARMMTGQRLRRSETEAYAAAPVQAAQTSEVGSRAWEGH